MSELAAPIARATWRDFLEMCKPRVVLLGHGGEESRKWFEDQIRTRHPKIKVIQPQPGQSVEV